MDVRGKPDHTGLRYVAGVLAVGRVQLAPPPIPEMLVTQNCSRNVGRTKMTARSAESTGSDS